MLTRAAFVYELEERCFGGQARELVLESALLGLLGHIDDHMASIRRTMAGQPHPMVDATRGARARSWAGEEEVGLQHLSGSRVTPARFERDDPKTERSEKLDDLTD